MIDLDAFEGQLPPTVLTALREHPIAPLLGLPADQVLQELALPALPQPQPLPPLPGLPPLPPLDPAALIRPITDLFGGFGNGDLAAGGALNPQTVLRDVVRAVETAMQWAAQGIALLQTMQSAGTAAAAGAAVVNQGVSAAISAQGAQMNLTLGSAAVSVATGYAQMAAVAARFAVTAASLAPALATPPGQAALLATAVEAGTEAVAITVRTKSELAGHQAQMDQAGTRVQTRTLPGATTVARTMTTELGAGSGSGGARALPELLRLFSHLHQVAQPLVTAARELGRPPAAPAPAAPGPAPRAPYVPAVLGAPGVGTAPGTGAAPTGPAAAPLGRVQADLVADPVPGPQRGGTGPGGVTVVADHLLPPLVPATGPLSDIRARPTGETSGLLVDARHGDELAGGAADETTTPVVGDPAAGDPGRAFPS